MSGVKAVRKHSARHWMQQAVLAEVSEQKATYDKKYSIFRKLLFASDKSIPLSEIMDCVDKVVVDVGKEIVVKWNQS